VLCGIQADPQLSTVRTHSSNNVSTAEHLVVPTGLIMHNADPDTNE